MKKIRPLLLETYLKVIKNSLGTEMFQTFHAEVNGQEEDIMRKGELSCAFFASAVLTIFNLIKRIHGTVDGTEFDLKLSGWKKIKEPKIGSVLIWEEKEMEGEIHKHIGFYIDKDLAISNDPKTGKPVKHNWLFDNKRKVTAVYWHKKLN